MPNLQGSIFTQQTYSPNRISLKQYQCIRRRWSLKQILCVISLSLILLWTTLFSNDNQTGLALTDNQMSNNNYLSNRENSEYSISMAQSYFNSFCQTNKCQQNDSAMILSFIQLLSQEKIRMLKITPQNTMERQLTSPVVPRHQNNIQSDVSSGQIKRKINWEQLISLYSRHSLKELQLFAVKRLKLTTPKHKNNQLFDIFWSIFGFRNQYNGIDKLFQNGNIIWQVNTPFSSITIASHQLIQPEILQIDFLSDKLQNLAIFGLSINLKKQIFNVVSLGSYSINNGLNRIHCQTEECKQRYSMIRLVFSNMKIKRIRIYQLFEL